MPLDADILVLLLVALLALLIVGWLVHLERRISKLLVGKDAKSLEESITFAKTELLQQAQWKKEIERYLATVEERLSHTLHEAKTVRFNAFKGTGEGGNQSFATAFLSEKGNGVVISSLFTRDRVSVYAKPINKLSSSYDLTEEERKAVNEAVQSAQETKGKK
jgi:hypothetical protein